ncbi:unnamed protein product [marine sediment metagenome]|uniref:LamG-like jellyroll fold domain-containing protein n=1 Tax=marine sediment metagenome TaxID=412755 RepID=X1CG61_9ZZZZ
MAWIYPTKTTWGTILDKYVAATNKGYRFRTVNDDRLLGYVGTDAVNRIVFYSTATINQNAWNHVVMVFNGDTIRFYFDGQLDTISPANAIAIAVNALDVRIGISQALIEWFFGRIDEVRIFNRVLPPAEILNIFNAEKPFHW